MYEDSVCAGDLISEIKNLKGDLEIDDASRTCLLLYEKHSSNLGRMLQETEHGKLLVSEGFSEDIDYASNKNSVDAVPFYNQGVIQLKRQ